jgi:arylsulfatase A-like enzyme
VLVLVDGARVDVVRELLSRGDLPNLARLTEAGSFVTGTTAFPSTTVVAYVPLLFGRHPAGLGLPGIRWLDREDAAGGAIARWRAARSYCGVQGGWIDRDLGPAPSIFDLVPESIAICSPLTRGLSPGAHRLPVRRALLGAIAHYVGSHERLDRAVAEAWVAAADRPWRFLFVVFPGPDGLTHLLDPHHPRVMDSYRAIDRALGRFHARAIGRGEPPALFVVSDHGATPMHTHTDVATTLESWGVRTLRHPFSVWRRGAGAAVMVSGNASAQVWLRPLSGDPAPLRGGELPQHLLDRLAALPGVRVAAWRDVDGIVVVGPGGRATVREAVNEIHYEPSGGDPLGLGTRTLRLSDRALLQRSHGTDLPDAARQLVQLLNSDRSGDVVLAAESGWDFRDAWEVPSHRAGHGSLVRDHMEVPILSDRPLGDRPLRTADIMPTILERLGVPAPAGIDGISVSRLAGEAPLR